MNEIENNDAKRVKLSELDEQGFVVTENKKKKKQLIHNPYARPYYTENFPYETVRRMLELNTATPENGYNRDILEFAFTYRTFGDDTFWRRYLAFNGKSQFKDFVCNDEPLRIDIGSYGFSPPFFWRGQSDLMKRYEENYGSSHSSPLVIDVDLSDYDDVRNCYCKHKTQHCSQCHIESTDSISSCQCEWRNLGEICAVCWCFATAAMLVMDYVLRNFWGFADFYFIFSGKKGIHCWILDPHTEEYTEKDRLRFVASFEPWESEERLKLVDEHNLRQDTYSRNLDSIIELIFEQLILPTESLFSFSNEDTKQFLYQIFDPESMTEMMFDQFDEVFNVKNTKDCFVMWLKLKSFVDSVYPADTATAIKRRITYRYVFPRVDKSVTTQIAHPKKSPFSLHPETDKVCVPILPHHFEVLFNFQPSAVPFSAETTTTADYALQLERDVAISGYILKEISYCRAAPFKDFQVPVVREELEVRNMESALVFSTLMEWLKQNTAVDWLLPPWEIEHVTHYTRCKYCPSYIYVESSNTLFKWIVQKSWRGESYSKTTELALKVTWLVYLRSTFPQVRLSRQTISALDYFCTLWNLTPVQNSIGSSESAAGT